MVITVVPPGTKPKNSDGTGGLEAGERCAGEQCGNTVAKRGKGGREGGFGRFCTDCRSSISSSLPGSSQELSGVGKNQKLPKRTSAAISPNGSPPDPKKSRFSNSSNDFSEFLKDLEVSDREELIARVKRLVSMGQTFLAEKVALSSTLKSTGRSLACSKLPLPMRPLDPLRLDPCPPLLTALLRLPNPPPSWLQ